MEEAAHAQIAAVLDDMYRPGARSHQARTLRFTNFFERREGFKLWHKVGFCMLALGSALGLFLAAAASGLTQKG